jgi:hypothetical protein
MEGPDDESVKGRTYCKCGRKEEEKTIGDV